MLDHQARVEKFMRMAGQQVPLSPTMPDGPTRLLRAKLILEEAIETVHALGFDFYLMDPLAPENAAMAADSEAVFIERGEPDLVQIADGCADISVVSMGTLSACGINAEPLLRLIDESNLAKFTGDAHRREDGKWQKPTGWKAPDIAKILQEQPPRAV
jgi:predicted HAD superfamily Cof-like phosphohydrolase